MADHSDLDFVLLVVRGWRIITHFLLAGHCTVDLQQTVEKGKIVVALERVIGSLFFFGSNHMQIKFKKKDIFAILPTEEKLNFSRKVTFIKKKPDF